MLAYCHIPLQHLAYEININHETESILPLKDSPGYHDKV